jgi:cell division protein FtsW (lipid II flippase)
VLLVTLTTVIVVAATGAGTSFDIAGAVLSHGLSFGAILIATRLWAPRANIVLVPVVGLITALGAIEVFRIDPDLGRLQRWWLLVGAAIAVLTLRVLHRRGVVLLRRFRYLFLLAALLLLVLPLAPSGWPLGGATVNGSRLWVRLDLGDRDLSFQPGEAAKVLIVVFLASYLADRWQALAVLPRRLGPLRLPEPRQIVPVLIAFGASFLVLTYQRDLGASMLLFVVFVVMLFMATDRPTYLVGGGALAVGGAYAAASAFSHVGARVDAWLDPFSDFAGNGFQVAQGIFALADAGIVGSGFGSGTPWLIPAAATDYVFIALVEETGLAGGLALIAAYAILITAGFGIGLRATDRFRSLLAAGLTLVLAVQTLLILAGVLRLLPLTGITLPFVSYGGSSLLANMAIVALLLRVSHEEPG